MGIKLMPSRHKAWDLTTRLDMFPDQKQQVIYNDVMQIEWQHFLISVCEPLPVTILCLVERERESECPAL
jgi:hypothetical protein